MSMSVPGNSCRPCTRTITTNGCLFRLPGTCVYYSGANILGPDINTGDDINVVINKLASEIGSGSVTSVALSMPAAFTVTGSPITSAGTFTVTGAGTTSQYIRGDGSLATFPTATVTGANNGLTLSSSNIQLGQTISQIGDPAALLSDREIPMGAFTLTMRDSSGNSNVFGPGTLTSTRIIGGTNVTAMATLTTNTNSFSVNADNRITFGSFNNATSFSTPLLARKRFNTIASGQTITIGPTNRQGSILAIVEFENDVAANNNPITVSGAALANISSKIDFWPSAGGQVKTITGTISSYSVQVDAQGVGAGSSITNLIDYESGKFIGNSLGPLTITNRYGFKVIDLNGGSQITTNRWAFYQDGTTDGNFFAGLSGFGIPLATPTARVHIGAGTASAGTAPLKLTSGTLLSSAESGAVEFNGSHFYGTIGSTRYQLDQQVAPPGVYFSPAQSFDPSFVVFASAITFPSNSFIHGNPILWSILDHTTAHNSSFYTSVEGAPSSRIQVNYPNVKNVLNTTITVDETFGPNLIFVGSSTGLTSFSAPVTRPAVAGIRLTGNGTTTWLKNGLYASDFEIGVFSGGGVTGVNINTLNVDYDSIAISYMGDNNYHIKRLYSGLGSFNSAFALVDSTGSVVTSSPTSADEVTITCAGVIGQNIPMNVWQSGVNQFMDGGASNFWIFGTFECWLVASPIDTVSTLVRWQPIYPSATNYKIYRDTSPGFGTQVLIHTGTEGTYLDTGLTSNTTYYYKLVGVISGIDTDITTFTTNTKAF